MSSYQDILSQIEQLKLQAEDARKQEMSSAIAEIKRLMAQFGITPADLGIKGRESGKARAKTSAGEAQYRDPASGKTWTGRGRRPGWIVAAEAEGKTMESFRIK